MFLFISVDFMRGVTRQFSEFGDVLIHRHGHIFQILKLLLLQLDNSLGNMMCTESNGESLNDCFVRFESIVSSLSSCGPLAYSDNKCAKQLLYALDDHVWGMKITALEESADFTTLDTEKLFSKLKSDELSRKKSS
jgi:hypothetical protein